MCKAICTFAYLLNYPCSNSTAVQRLHFRLVGRSPFQRRTNWYEMSCRRCWGIYSLANCLSFVVWFICESPGFSIFIYSHMHPQSYANIYISSAHFRHHQSHFRFPCLQLHPFAQMLAQLSLIYSRAKMVEHSILELFIVFPARGPLESAALLLWSKIGLTAILFRP